MRGTITDGVFNGVFGEQTYYTATPADEAIPSREFSGPLARVRARLWLLFLRSPAPPDHQA